MIKEYKNKIIGFYETHRRMPVYTEIMSLIGFKSKNSVAKLIRRLIDEGFISKDKTGHLIPNRAFSEVPLLGLVEAGFPTLAEEQVLETLNLDDYLIKDRNSTYLLEVKGDSMIDAGICEGDLVIAEKKNTARDGDIVIALIDGGWTMKYYRARNGKIYLEPANKKFKDIYPEESLEIIALVRGVVRKY